MIRGRLPFIIAVVSKGLLLLIVAIFASLGVASAQTEHPENLYYHGYDYGSDAYFNPISMTLGYSYAIMQLNNRNNTLGSFDYAAASQNVYENLAHPISMIEQYGWWNFLSSEVIPMSFKMTNVQYWPNYKLHLIGGGMLHVAMEEWYEAHGYPYPKALSLVTNLGMHYLNEVVETGNYKGPDVDPIADMYIFGPLGYLLFSNEKAARFFSHTLNLAPWPFQAIYAPSTNELLNNGMKFSFKYFLPWNDRLGIFYLTGTEGMVGGSYRLNNGDVFTAGGGMAAKEIYQVETGTGVRVQSTTLIVTGGLFYDRNNSLLASLILGGARGYKVRLNVYPGVLPWGGKLAPGFAFMLQDHNQFAFGITLRYTPITLGFRS